MARPSSASRPSCGPARGWRGSPGGVGRPARPPVPGPPAAGPRLHAAAAPPGAPGARPGGHRRVAGPGPAARRENARRRGAAIALIDASGRLMAPPARRSGAPGGQPPALLRKGRHREKASAAAALWLSPGRDRLRLFTRAAVKACFNGERVAPFPGAPAGEAGGPLVAAWGGGSVHKGGPARGLLAGRDARPAPGPLPAYGPEPTPVERLGAWLKYGRLANPAPRDAGHLDGVARAELAAMEGDQRRLEGFFHASRLPRPRAFLL